MADGLADYWFQRPDRESQLPAIQVGLQMYQQRVRNELERKQLANQTAQTMLELQKGQALLDAKLKQEQGFTELNGLLAQTAKDEAWLNPDNQAKYWDVVSRYPQVLQGGMADRLFDSTFGAAQRSKEKAAALQGMTDYRNSQILAAQERLAIAQQNADTAATAQAQRELEFLLKPDVNRVIPPSIAQQRLLLNDKITALKERKAAISGMFKGAEKDAIQKQIDAAEAERDALLNRPTPSVGSTNPLPLPKVKSELQKGATYNTSRGIATWDGEKFVQ